MYNWEVSETGAAALLFAATFLVSGRVRRALFADRRSTISFGAGMSVAYVFVHVLPELAGVRRSFTEAMPVLLRYEGMAIYFVALVGFLVFYGRDYLRAHVRKTTEAEESKLTFRLHVGGFAAYVWLIGYLLVNNLEESRTSTGLFATAIAFHFLAVGHALRSEYGAAYERIGRFVLAAMAMIGWGMGFLFVLPRHVLALLVAFISGAIIMNSTIMELPSEKDGRFLPFMIGGIVYGLILLPLG